MGALEGTGLRTADQQPTGSPAISVVIPTRNRRALLEEAVDSVIAQSYTDWELVVVDDASQDDTWSWLESLSDPRIRCWRLVDHQEQSGARNAGVRRARGPIIVSLDDDDLLASDALDTHLQALQRYPEAIASVGGYTVFDARGARTLHRVVRRRCVRDVWQDVLFGWIATAGQCAFRRQALLAVDLWDESWRRVTDHELWARIGLSGPVALSPNVVLHYRIHPGQWRPENLDELMTQARQRGLNSAEGQRRALGEETLRVRALALEAFDHYLDAQAARALGLYLAVVRRMPYLLSSPLTRPLVLRPMSRCLSGSFGIRLGRRFLDRADRWRGRDVDFSVRETRTGHDSDEV